jgi:hypothetical protein
MVVITLRVIPHDSHRPQPPPIATQARPVHESVPNLIRIDGYYLEDHKGMGKEFVEASKVEISG